MNQAAGAAGFLRSMRPRGELSKAILFAAADATSLLTNGGYPESFTRSKTSAPGPPPEGHWFPLWYPTQRHLPAPSGT